MHYALCKIFVILYVNEHGSGKKLCIITVMHYQAMHYDQVNCTTDPQLLPPKILNSLDYVVSGPNRSPVSREFLEKHFTESMVPRDKPHDRRVLIWSPNSLAFRNEAEYDEEGFGRSWDLALAYVRFDVFNPTNSPPVK
jgi:hypothetical protein